MTSISSPNKIKITASMPVNSELGTSFQIAGKIYVLWVQLPPLLHLEAFMKKLFLSLILTLFAFSAFAEMKQYISDDYTKIGVIEFVKVSDTQHAVSVSYLTSILGNKMQNTAMLVFKIYSDAKAFYDEKSKADDFDSFYKVYTEVINSEKYKAADLQKFDNDGTFTTFRIIDYDAPLEKVEVTQDKLDSNYETLTFKEIIDRKYELENKKIAVFNTKLIGADPEDSKGYVPVVIKNEADDESLMLRIPPEWKDFFYKNKRESLNYYGTFVIKESWDYYIIVEKITKN